MDRLAALHAFIRLVDLGTFTAVAEELRVKQSTVSKWIASIEATMGTQLLDRTTRGLRVTEAGRRFYEHAVLVLDAYEAALGVVVQTQDQLYGRVRISAPVVFGRRFVVPLMQEYLCCYPKIELEIVLDDHYVRLVEEGFDLVVRLGAPVDSSLRSHPLGTTPRRLVAAPEYIRRYGSPKTPSDLKDHQCLVHSPLSTETIWRFEHNSSVYRCPVRGKISVNNSEATLDLAKEGLGICLLADWLVVDEIQQGTLVPLLESFRSPDASVQALTAPGRYMPARVRSVLDALRRGLTRAFSS